MHVVTNTSAKAQGRVIPWNKGKLLGQKPPLKFKEIWAIRIRLQLDHRTREMAQRIRRVICRAQITGSLRPRGAATTAAWRVRAPWRS